MTRDPAVKLSEPFDVFVRRVVPDFADLILQAYDELRARLRKNHDDVRKASERAEMAYRERDELRAEVERYRTTLQAIAGTSPELHKDKCIKAASAALNQQKEPGTP